MPLKRTKWPPAPNGSQYRSTAAPVRPLAAKGAGLGTVSRSHGMGHHHRGWPSVRSPFSPEKQVERPDDRDRPQIDAPAEGEQGHVEGDGGSQAELSAPPAGEHQDTDGSTAT